MQVARTEAWLPGFGDTMAQAGEPMTRQTSSRRPTLLGSPMRTPLASPSFGPAVVPRSDVPSLMLDDEETAALQAAIEASLGSDMKRRLQASLQSTEQELCGVYPEETGVGRDIKRARVRTSSDLEAAVGEIRASPRCSPKSSAKPSPEISPATGPSQDALEFEMVESADLPAAVLGTVPEEAAPELQSNTYEFEGLLDHELLLESLYASQGIDLRAQQDKATALLAEVGLKALDLGVKNWDEHGRELVNQCFYLCIARSYLGAYVDNEECNKVALMLKRTVEACVLTVHPEWARDDERLGENAMAFADFLPIAMGAKDPPNIVASMAVLILDATQGHAEVYLGPSYQRPEPHAPDRDREELEKNLVLLCYTPGHYKVLVKDDEGGSKPSWTYGELKGLLDERGVMCIETSDFD